MLYNAYEMQRSMLAGASAMANFGAGMASQSGQSLRLFRRRARSCSSALEVFAHAAAPRGKPAFGCDHTVVDGKQVGVVEEIVLRKPFGQLKRFAREGVERRHRSC